MNRQSKKPGPDPERLKIEDDPGEVLDHLLGVDDDDESDKSDEIDDSDE